MCVTSCLVVSVILCLCLLTQKWEEVMQTTNIAWQTCRITPPRLSGAPPQPFSEAPGSGELRLGWCQLVWLISCCLPMTKNNNKLRLWFVYELFCCWSGRFLRRCATLVKRNVHSVRPSPGHANWNPVIERLEEYCWNSTVWNLEFDEARTPLLFTHIPINWGLW